MRQGENCQVQGRQERYGLCSQDPSRVETGQWERRQDPGQCGLCDTYKNGVYVTNEETFSELVSGLSKATEPLGAGIQSPLCPHLGGGRPAGVRRGRVGRSLRRGLNWAGSFQTTGWAEVWVLSYKWGCARWRHRMLLGIVGTGFAGCHQAGTGMRTSQGGT